MNKGKIVKPTAPLRARGHGGEFHIGEATVFIVNENGAWINIEGHEPSPGPHAPIYLVGCGHGLVTFLEAIVQVLRKHGSFSNIEEQDIPA